MAKTLGTDDLIDEVKNKVYIQDYSKKTSIDGVKIINLANHVAEEGDFSEIIRLSENGEIEGIPNFKLAQVNRTKLYPGSIKAWHLHFEQDEIWYLIPSGHLLVGLWDLRKDSPTKDQKMRIVLGGGNQQLLFIPKGVAHGSVCFVKKSVELFYFVNRKFDINNPDEKRINWDILGKDFWMPERD